MTDAELSRELALALGWKDIYPHSPETDAAWFRRNKDYIAVSEGPGPRGTMLVWRKFDYRDPSVVAPLIKWLMVEHGATMQWMNGIKAFEIYAAYIDIYADTLEAAVARAVIAVGRG